jgi:hypothetical protein
MCGRAPWLVCGAGARAERLPLSVSAVDRSAAHAGLQRGLIQRRGSLQDQRRKRWAVGWIGALAFMCGAELGACPPIACAVGSARAFNGQTAHAWCVGFFERRSRQAGQVVCGRISAPARALNGIGAPGGPVAGGTTRDGPVRAIRRPPQGLGARRRSDRPAPRGLPEERRRDPLPVRGEDARRGRQRLAAGRVVQVRGRC